jgi:uncharacterized protein YjbJ (UPF0337 family)
MSLRAKGQLQSAAGRVQRKMGEAQRDLDEELEKDID